MLASLQNATTPATAGTDVAEVSTFQLHFQSLFHADRDLAFPCDENGQVNLDGLTARSRNNYLYARAMLGREFAWPSVREIRPDHARSSTAPAIP
jgi:hypothetical protein